MMRLVALLLGTLSAAAGYIKEMALQNVPMRDRWETRVPSDASEVGQGMAISRSSWVRQLVALPWDSLSLSGFRSSSRPRRRQCVDVARGIGFPAGRLHSVQGWPRRRP